MFVFISFIFHGRVISDKPMNGCFVFAFFCILSSFLASPAFSQITPTPEIRNTASPAPLLAWERYEEPLHQSPTIANGKIYVLCKSGIFKALEVDTGKVLWQLSLSDYLPKPMNNPLFNPLSSPAPVVIGNTVIVGISNITGGHIFSLNCHDSSLLWHYESPRKDQKSGLLLSEFAIGENTVVVQTGGGLTAIRLSDGTPLWTVVYDRAVVELQQRSARPVIEKGILYVGADFGTAYALRMKDGIPLWKFSTDGITANKAGVLENIKVSPAYCSPLLISDSLYTVDGIGNIYCLDKNTGRLQWKKNIGYIWMILPHNERLLLITSNGLIELSPQDGNIQRTCKIEGGIFSCALTNHSTFLGRNSFVNPG